MKNHQKFPTADTDKNEVSSFKMFAKNVKFFELLEILIIFDEDQNLYFGKRLLIFEMRIFAKIWI